MDEKKKCPYCGEEIMAIAKKCRHCGEWLETGEAVEDENMTSSPVEASADDAPVSVADKKTVDWKKISIGIAVVIALIIVFSIVGSNSSSNDNEWDIELSEEAKKDVSSIKEWLTNTYADVLKGDDFDGSKMRKYLSSEFYKAYCDVVEYDSNKEGIGFLNSDFWTHAQDGGGWKMEIKDVQEANGMLDGSQYYADIKLTGDFGAETNLYVYLLKENGGWRISEVSEGGTYQKVAMMQYLHEEKEEQQKAIAAAQEAMNIWEGMYRQNEFGEANKNCPYIYASRIAQDAEMSVEIGKCDGIKFISRYVAENYKGFQRLSIKTLNNGEVFTFPAHDHDGELYVTDSQAINHIISIMAAGNYIISITCQDPFMEKPTIFTTQVGIETMGIMEALKFLER